MAVFWVISSRIVARIRGANCHRYGPDYEREPEISLILSIFDNRALR